LSRNTLHGTANSTHRDSDSISVGGKVTSGITSALDRTVYLKTRPWVAVSLLGYEIESNPAELLMAINKRAVNARYRGTTPGTDHNFLTRLHDLIEDHIASKGD
jgi:hypothetical protein